MYNHGIMTQRELIKTFAEKADITSAKAKEILTDVLPTLIFSELRKNGNIKLAGLGKLKIAKTKARTGISPATGKQIKIPAKTKIRFLACKEAKEKVAKF